MSCMGLHWKVLLCGATENIWKVLSPTLHHRADGWQKKTTNTLKNSPIWEMGFSDKYRSCFQREDMVRGRPARLPWGQWGLPVHSRGSKQQIRDSTNTFICQLSLVFPSSVMYNQCISFTSVADQNLTNTSFLQILDIAGSAELTLAAKQEEGGDPPKSGQNWCSHDIQFSWDVRAGCYLPDII